MKNTKMVQLGEVLQYEQPGQYIVQSTDYNDTFTTPVLTPGQTFILGYTNETTGIYTKPLPVIIFDDFTTAIKFVDFPFKVKSSAMKILYPDDSIADVKYLFYQMQTLKINCTEHKRYWISKYSQIEIPLPPLDQQKKIAAILDAADTYRQKTKALIAKYDELAQSLFLEMFGDPVRNPMGWKKESMGELMTIVRGGSPRPIEKFIGGSNPWIKIGDATKGEDIYLRSTKEHIIDAGLSKTRVLPAGSLIFANCGVSLGFARIITFQGCIHDGWLAFSDFDENVIDKIFLLKALNSITQHFRDSAPEGTQPNLNTGIMKDFEIILPPIDLQRRFVTSLEEISKQKNLSVQSLEKAEELFNSLLQRAFKGELV